jgi:DNA-binding CsgD family transcriptional regulator
MDGRELLRRAVLAIEASPAARSDATLELEKTRWSLVDRVELEGRRYIVARETPPELTPRERQVVAFAKLGHHNKLIAYELGIAASTVRVLLRRAAQKLGVRASDIKNLETTATSV